MKNKYQGLVIDRLSILKSHKTKYYETYYLAHQAAEKLCKKYLGDRGNIKILEIEN